MIRIVFFGTPIFARNILEDLLLDEDLDIVAIVTKPDKPQGRSSCLVNSPVKELAIQKNIPVYDPIKASDEDFCSFLKTLDVDFFVVVAFGEIFKESLLNCPKVSCINIHGSLLPKYRGAAPVQRAIMAGDSETGLSIITMEKLVDAGKILHIEVVKIDKDATSGDMFNLLYKPAVKAVLFTLKNFKKCLANAETQDLTKVSFAPKITKQECEIVDFNQEAVSVYNFIRGVSPAPGAWCYISIKGVRKKIIFKKVSFVFDVYGNPGEFVLRDKKLILVCLNGGISLEIVHVEGKKEQNIQNFLNGFKLSDLHL